jgi:beta-glucanase (GH16 family)
LTTLKDGLLEEVGGIRLELDRLLTGMEYCLDWKPEEGEWSVREVVYHIVDTPEGGIQDAVQRTLDGTLAEITVNGNLSNMTDERLGKDMEAVKADIEVVLSGMERALAPVTDSELSSRETVVHSTMRGVTQTRSARNLSQRLFAGHWREHLSQIAALRDALGIT